jgi:S1-C subfamily serine protease
MQTGRTFPFPSFCSLTAAAILSIAWLPFGMAASADEGDFSAVAVKRGKAATAMVDLGKNGSGTGFLVHASGIFVTNRHVVEHAPAGKPVMLVLNSGEANQRRVPARVILLSETDDLALIKTDEPLKLEPLRLADETKLAELSRIAVLGYPFGKMLATGSDQSPAISINAGRVSALRKEGGVLERIQLDAATNPGNSGGPVMMVDGGVVGVVVSGIGGANVNFAIPAARVKKLIAQPVLSMRVPEIPFSKRAEVQELDLEIFPTTPVPADAALVVHFGEGAKRRSFTAEKKDGKYRIKAAPLDPSGPLRLYLTAQVGVLRFRANLDDCPVKLGGKRVQLSEIRSMATEGKVVKTTLVHFDEERGQFAVVDGRPSELPVLRSQMNDATVDFEKAVSLNVSAYDLGTLKVPYEIELKSKERVIASARGQIPLTDPPAGLRQDETSGRSSMSFATMFRRSGMMMGPPEQDLDLLAIGVVKNDVKSGTWERKGTGLETKAEPDAWCESPVVPTGNYELRLEFTPRVNANGELLIHLPIGRSHAMLRVNGSAQGFAKLDLVGQAQDGSGQVSIPPFEKDQERELSISVATRGEDARIFAMMGGGTPLMWIGKLKNLAVPKVANIAPDRVAIGHQGLPMWLKSYTVSAPEGSLRVLREWIPTFFPDCPQLVAAWELNYPWAGKKVLALTSDNQHVGNVVGTPEFVTGQGVGGSGAMKLGGKSAGFTLSECPHSNQGRHPARAISMWFRADRADDKAARCYLFDEGGVERGYAVYLLGGTIYAGGWDHPAKPKWDGTWFKADGIVAGKWHHFALTLDSSGKDKSKALRFYLDGAEVGSGFGNLIGDHERLTFGTMFNSSRTSPAEPTDVAVQNQQFAGLIDKVQVYNEPRSAATVKILSGGQYTFSPPLPPPLPPPGRPPWLAQGVNNVPVPATAPNPPIPPPVLDAALAQRIKTAIDARVIQRLGPVGGKGEDGQTDLPSVGALLVGFEYIKGYWGSEPRIKSLKPIFLTPAGQISGKTRGKPNKEFKTVVAKPGFAVSGLIVIPGGERLGGFQVIFSRITPGPGKPETYKSEAIGGEPKENAVTLGGDGKLGVGIFGVSGGDVQSIGLIVAP